MAKKVLEIECSDDVLLPYLTTMNVVGVPVDVASIEEAFIDGIVAVVGAAYENKVASEEVRVRLKAKKATLAPRAIPPVPPPAVPVPTLTFVGLPASVDVDTDAAIPGQQVDVSVLVTDGPDFSRVILENLTTGIAYSATLDPVTRGAVVRVTLADGAAPGVSNELRATSVHGGVGLLATGSILAITPA
jgi:hypothetical protein